MKNLFSNKKILSQLIGKGKVLLLALIFILGGSSTSKACTPFTTPTLASQAIVGGNLEMVWTSLTAWACQYKIEVELTCNTSAFSGISNFTTVIITKPNTGPMNYPILSINLATLCPGTAYKFRAREIPGGGGLGSNWTPTFNFTTPGVFVLPIIQPIPNPTICPTNTTQLTANLQNPCGPGPVTYSWAPALGLSCITCSNPIATPTLPTSYTVTVQGGGLSCWTATNAVTVYTSSGSAQVLATAIQLSCTNTLTAVSLTTAGSASVPISVIWNPVPGSISGNSLNATGLPVGITTVVVTDAVGCIKTTTINILPAPPPVTFTINNLTNSHYSITCNDPIINLQAVTNYTYGTLNYTWTSPSFTATTSTVNIGAPNTLTVIATDPLTNCVATLMVSVGINTTTPTNTVAPLSQAITCNSGAPVTFSGTVTNPTVNFQHDWYSPLNPLPGGVPIATSNNSLSILSGAIPPGIYTLVTTNQLTGCKAFKTVTVTSLDAWPTFSISSPTNYSVGCSPLNQTTLSIINPVSTQTPPSICSFTFLPPGFAGTVNPGIPLGNNTSTTTQIPGTWTVIVQDNSNFCRTILSVPIIQNTVAPHVLASILQQTLTCYHPTLLATGTSSTPNTIITWGIPVAPNQLSTHTVEVGPANGPNTSTTSLTYANYTVIATNTLNACQTTSVMIVNQNFKPPVSSPTISIGTPTSIYCTVANNPVVLTTGSSTTTSGGGALAFVVNPCWDGPSPQTTLCGTSSYSCYVAGVYSLTIQDNYNGCLKTGTINVLDKTQPPVVTVPVANATLDCGANKANLLFAITGASVGLKFYFTDYPHGAAFTPSTAIILPGTSTSSVGVDGIGDYYYTVTNTLTGCVSNGTFVVAPGDLLANFSANYYAGYAPLDVAFDNLSASSLGSASITSIWSYGNGTSQTTTSNISTSTTFTAPGTYTVLLIASKGSCLDTTYRIVKVDAPSKLEAPNVFTPNGDGSNDVFFLKTINLGEITAVIFDRWGNKVYDVNSSTGNIAWDGKNLQGKECVAGTYFYIIKATAKDSKAYDTKGNVTLIR